MKLYFNLSVIVCLSFWPMCAPMPTFTIERQLFERTWVGRIVRGGNFQIKAQHYNFLVEDPDAKTFKSSEYNIFKISGATVICEDNGEFKLWSPNFNIQKYGHLNSGKVVELRGKLVCDEKKYGYPGQLLLMH